MTLEQPTLTAGGANVPQLGFGTWQMESDTARRMVGEAIGIGYRHIGTAYIYKNEAAVGEGMRDSGVSRDDLFVTTKIWVDSFAEGDLQRAAEASVERLGLTPDLLLLHWPKASPPLAETIPALNDARTRGFTKHIGLSNFPSAQWREAQALSEAPLITNQVEYHPYLSQKTIIATAAELGGLVTAWSPLAQGRAIDDVVIAAIAAAHGKSTGQVALRWLIQQGVIAIPKTQSSDRAAENFAIFDFSLTDDEMARIHALAEEGGRIGDWIDPAFQFDRD